MGIVNENANFTALQLKGGGGGTKGEKKEHLF